MTVYHVLREEDGEYPSRIDSSITLVAPSDASLRLHDDHQHDRFPFGDQRWQQNLSYGGYKKISFDCESRDTAVASLQVPEEAHSKPLEPPSTDLEQGKKPAPGPKKPLFTVFSTWEKRWIVAICAWGGFISPISNAIYLPVLNELAVEFNVTITQMNLTITTFLIFMALSPMFVGNFADSAGYRPAFIACFIVYLGANVGLALQDNYLSLLLLRALQSMGSSGTVALRNGVIASVITPAERGTALGIINIGTLIGPAFGPLIGGALAETVGWRWIFWFLALVTASALILQVLLVPETNRKIVGNGALPPWEWWNVSLFDMERRKKFPDRASHDAKRKAMGLPPRAKIGWPNPMPSLVMLVEKDTAIVLLCGALNFAALYEIMVSVPLIYRKNYGFNTLQISLVYIAIGGGAAVSAIFNGRLLDFNFRKTAKEHGLPVDKKRGQDLRHFPIEKARMRAVFPLLMFGASSVLVYGWLLDKRISLASALIFCFLSSVGVTCCFGSMNSLLIDSHPGSPATVTAAANITRCLLAAAASATIDPLIHGMGVGWCFTFISLLLFSSAPLLWVIVTKGPIWREERYVKKERKEAAEKAAADAPPPAKDTREDTREQEVRPRSPFEEKALLVQSPYPSPDSSPKLSHKQKKRLTPYPYPNLLPPSSYPPPHWSPPLPQMPQMPQLSPNWTPNLTPNASPQKLKPNVKPFVYI